MKKGGFGQVSEIWSKLVGPSEFFNVERKGSLERGGGALYFQVVKTQVPGLLRFLKSTYPKNGRPIVLTVRTVGAPDVQERLEFWSKSMGRMRTGRQNRQRKQRLKAWSPEMGFPRLSDDVTSSSEARVLLKEVGGLHIYLARDKNGEAFAGYTTGAAPDALWGDWPFNKILFGNSPGGYWSA